MTPSPCVSTQSSCTNDSDSVLPGADWDALSQWLGLANLDSAIGLDSVLPGANWERALTESGRARDAPSSFAGARDAMTLAQVLKEGKGQASKFAFDRLACWSAPCEARVQL